jgi:hypothetical protein
MLIPLNAITNSCRLSLYLASVAWCFGFPGAVLYRAKAKISSLYARFNSEKHHIKWLKQVKLIGRHAEDNSLLLLAHFLELKRLVSLMAVHH